ncbi:MAG: mevalonate kinase [Myxococcales bacterium]|nr:mevalonate kinase [Myxococcota bacterium]MDW8282405.1 mevalonate kinase [Myxococcales bacterium]
MVAGSACGKVILLGEHAVVYGHPALCGALRDGVQIEAVPGSGILSVPAWGLRVSAVKASDGSDLARAYGAVLASLGIPPSALHHDLVVRFSIPTGAGLGSSAALSVALARALGAILQIPLTPDQVARAAQAAEEVFHGRCSGLDHTVAQQGGFGLFRRPDGLVPLKAPPLPLCIGLTGRPRDTRGRVARVAELYRDRPVETRTLFRRIEELVEAAARAVTSGDLRALGTAMDENQVLLGQLEVSCPEIDQMCQLARSAGAWGAKLTGGGGGGCVIALSPGAEAAVHTAWRRAGFTSFDATIGGVEALAA